MLSRRILCVHAGRASSAEGGHRGVYTGLDEDEGLPWAALPVFLRSETEELA